MSEAHRSEPPVLDFPTLLERITRHGDRVALSFYRGKSLQGRMSYGELCARAEALAGRLQGEFAVRAGDRVALLTPNRLEVPVLVLALLRLGAVVVPLNPGSAPSDWEYILDHSGARGLCATSDLLAQLPVRREAGAFALAIESAFDGGGGAPSAGARLDESLAVVLYTSGTTGHPKGVSLRQRSLLWNAWSMARNFGLDGATQLAVLPLYHAHAFGFGLMTALSSGGHLVFTERLEPFTWAEVVRTESVSVSSVVPTLLPMLLAVGVTRSQVPTLRHLLVSSAPLTVDLARRFETRTQIPLIQGWGLSEYTNFACCAPTELAEADHELLMFAEEVPSVGPALEGTEVRVVDAAGVSVDDGVRGELVVRGPSTMLGYLDDATATALVLDSDGWLRTGDEGFSRTYRGRSVFFITGRLKEIIIRDGEKYSPLGLEKRIVEAIPELSGKLVVLGFPHDDHGEEVGAYVELDPLDDGIKARLAALIGAMPVSERPKVVLHGPRPISRTHTGKVQRRKMQGWFSSWSKHRGVVAIVEVGGDE